MPAGKSSLGGVGKREPEQVQQEEEAGGRRPMRGEDGLFERPKRREKERIVAVYGAT